MKKRRPIDLTPPEPRKLPPPGPRYYRNIERHIGQQRLPFEAPEYPKLKRAEASDE